jgi:hypothetical protein
MGFFIMGRLAVTYFSSDITSAWEGEVSLH